MTHKNLDAWKYSMNLALEVYNVTKEFPKDELYGITNQIRRCAVSIPSNIAEGCARKSLKETIRFLYISLGSVAELETQLLLSEQLKYFDDLNEIIDKLNHVKGLILGLIKYYKKKDKNE